MKSDFATTNHTGDENYLESTVWHPFNVYTISNTTPDCIIKLKL